MAAAVPSKVGQGLWWATVPIYYASSFHCALFLSIFTAFTLCAYVANSPYTGSLSWLKPSKDEAQTALFKGPVRTAL